MSVQKRYAKKHLPKSNYFFFCSSRMQLHTDNMAHCFDNGIGALADGQRVAHDIIVR